MRIDKLVAGALSVIVIGGLASVFVLPFVADGAVRSVVQEGAASGQDVSFKPAGQSPDLGLRRLPLVEPGGAVEKAFGQGTWRDSEQLSRQAAEGVASAGGLDQELADLWPAMAAAARGFVMRDKNLGDNPDRWYPPVREVVRSWPLDRVRAKASAFNELAASLLIASSYHSNTGGGWEQIAGTSAGALVLFDRIREVVPSCDAELNYTLTLTLGQHPREAALRPAIKRMLDACPASSDATWLAAAAAQSLHWVEREPDDQPIKDEDARAQVTRASIVEAFTTLPASPLRFAAEGFFVLQRAEQALETQTKPFTARELAREALALFQKARSTADHPTLMAAEARAQAVLGDLKAANELLAQAGPLAPETGIIQTLRAEYLERAGDWAQAAQYAKPIYPASPGISLAPTGFGSGPTWDPVQLAVTAASPTWVMDPTYVMGAGGYIQDLGALPAYRDDRYVTAPMSAQRQVASCPVAGQVRRLLVLGRYADALRVYEETAALTASQEWRNSYGQPCPRPVTLAAVAAQLSDDPRRRDELLGNNGESLDAMFDVGQNVFRYGKEFDRALEVTDAWAQTSPANGLAHHRAAEIHYLAGNLPEGEVAFERAVALYEQASPGQDVPAYWSGDPEGLTQLVTVQRGIIAQQQGDIQAARSAFTAVAAASLDYSEVYEVARSYALLQLGILELRENQPEAAASALGEINFPTTIATGPVANNLALALILSSRGRDALPVAQRALKEDPANPIYLETLALAQEASGDEQSARGTYGRASEKDPSLFTATNNEAVLLARDGKLDEAREKLRSSLSANPGYAKAWANVAMVELARGTPDGYLRALGASSIATGLDRGLRGAGYGWQVELGVYDTGIDLSRPLPPEWSFARVARPALPGLTLIMLLLVVVRLAQVLASDKSTGWLTEKSLAVAQKLSGTRWPKLSRSTPGWVTTLIAVVMSVKLSTMAPEFNVWEHLTLGVGLLGLVVGVSLIRRLGGGPAVTELTWWPLVMVAMLLSALSLPLLPIPSLVGPPARARPARIGGLLFMGSVAVAMTAVELVSGSPVARAIAGSAVLMVATALLPFGQMDGQVVRSRWANVVISAALLASGVAYAMLWL